ncbi:MAG: exosortase [Nitrospirae bacterium]|nr:exosortase [Nitrospirota bacterium]
MINSLIWILAAVLYAPVFHNLYFGKTNWALEDYSHIYFILPISLYLAWQKREALNKLLQEEKESAAGIFVSFFLLLVGVMIFIFGWRRGYDLIFIFSLVPVLFGLTGYLYGSKIAKALSFPILYLLFLVPPPAGILDSITLPMRYGVSFAVEGILGFFNYPIKREGLLLSIGYKDLYMASACSGFRSLIAMLSLSFVYIYLIRAGLFKKIILAAIITPLALTGNLIRVITLCLITFYFGEEAGRGFFHIFSGVIIFMITILGLIYVEMMLNRCKPEKADDE